MEELNAHIRTLYCAAPAGWYKGLYTSNEILLMDEERYTERSFRNKFEIYAHHGRQTLSIPLQKETRRKRYSEVKIAYAEHWQNHFVHALRSAYGSSPYYEYYDYMFEPLFKKQYTFLWDLNMDLLLLTLKCLKLDPLIRIERGKYMKPEEFPEVQPYYQVFSDQKGFSPGLSILDLLFNEGIESFKVLQ